MRLLRALLAFYCLWLALCSGAKGLQIVAIASGAAVDLLSVSAVLNAADVRGHSAVVVVDSSVTAICEQVFGHARCLPFQCSAHSCQNNRQIFGQRLRKALLNFKFIPDVFLATAYLENADQASIQYGVPLIALVNGAADVSLQPTHPHIVRNQHSFTSSLLVAMRNFLADARRTFFSKPTTNFYASHHILVQGISGLDITAPSCPNIHNLGLLADESDFAGTRRVISSQNWNDACTNGFVYVYLQETRHLPTANIYDILQSIIAATNACVLWYDPQEASVGLDNWHHANNTRLYRFHHLLYSTPHVFSDLKPLVVLSNSISSTLHGAVFAEAPSVFISTGNTLCGRIEDAGVGKCVAHRPSSNVVSAVATLINSHPVREQVRAFHRLGSIMGGAAKAVDVIELAARLGAENADFFCDAAVFRAPHGFSASVVLAASFALTIFCVLLFSGTVRVFRRA